MRSETARTGEIISVILPVYNVEPYVGKCLESILAQTCQNLEVICVDDGSADRSGQICEEYAARDKRVIVLHKENGGAASARNMGLNIFSGNYVSFIDPDDWVEPDMYERLLSALVRSPEADFSTCGYFMDYPDGRSTPIKNQVEIPEQLISPPDYLYYVYQRDLYRGVAGYPVGKLFKRSLFEGSAGVRFDEEYPVGEDTYPLVRCVLRSSYIVFEPQPLYHYYQRETSLSHVMSNTLGLSDVDSYGRVVETLAGTPAYARACAYAKRFAVYHAGLVMEYTLSTRNREKTAGLLETVQKYLDVYLETNAAYPERIQWIQRLLTEAEQLLDK